MFAWLFAAHLAIASPERPLLEWSAPASCADQEAVEGRLQQLIPGERAQTLSARAVVTKDGDRFRMRIELASATGESVRELESSSCAVLAEAAAFVVAVAIDPAVATTALRDDAIASPSEAPEPEPPEPEPSIPTPPREQPPASLQPDDAPSAKPTAPPRRVGAALRAGLAVGTHEVSRIDLAPSLTAAIRGRYWRSELALRYVAGRDEPIGQGSLRLDAIGGVARGCGVAPAGPLEIPICAGLDLAAVRARPRGLLLPHDQTALRVAIDVAIALAWPLTRRVALWVEAAGGFAVLRPNFTVRGTEARHLGSAASFSGLVGVELRLPGRLR